MNSFPLIPVLNLTTVDIILAADTLWDMGQHTTLLHIICAVLAWMHTTARAHLIAGSHTEWYTLDAFFWVARTAGLMLVEATAREVQGGKDNQGSGKIVSGQRQWQARLRTSVSVDDESLGCGEVGRLRHLL